MKKFIRCLLLAVVFCSVAYASDQYLPGNDNRFQLADNKSGGGFYWVDTANGRTWTLDRSKKAPTWVYCGKPATSRVGDVGSYIPYSNRNGRGVYILNTSDGRGWFYDGKKWVVMGKPVPRPDEKM